MLTGAASAQRAEALAQHGLQPRRSLEQITNSVHGQTKQHIGILLYDVDSAVPAPCSTAAGAQVLQVLTMPRGYACRHKLDRLVRRYTVREHEADQPTSRS